MIEQAQIHFRDPTTSAVAMMLRQAFQSCRMVLTNVNWHIRKFIQENHKKHVYSDGFGLMLGEFIQQDFILSLKSQAIINPPNLNLLIFKFP